METLTIELPSQKEQTAFNLRRWAELLVDPALAKFEGRIETDRHGHAIMSPPPAASHGRFQSRIAHILQTLMKKGETLTECPISTADGVRAADVAWASPTRMEELGNRVCFPRSPEVCVEVLSPANTESEIQEKIELYFNAGAQEVWLCDRTGKITFLGPDSSHRLKTSKICPRFPARIDLKQGS
jgi:Uma2 family endonuclease